MTTSTNLPTDTYYRGYRLSTVREGEADMEVLVWFGPEHIDTFFSYARAKSTIDGWLNAR